MGPRNFFLLFEWSVRGVDDDNKVKYSYPCLIPSKGC